MIFFLRTFRKKKVGLLYWEVEYGGGGGFQVEEGMDATCRTCFVPQLVCLFSRTKYLLIFSMN